MESLHSRLPVWVSATCRYQHFLEDFPGECGINDPGGYWLGRTSRTNRVVILNQWIRSNDRVNSNWFISGLPGSGKSTAIKKIQTCEYSFGTKIITLDPEEEYVDLAAHPDINGDVIDCAGGSTGRINPLQVKYSPRITEDDLNDGEILTIIWFTMRRWEYLILPFIFRI